MTNLTRETQDYINRYRVIYKRVIREAKSRENDRYVLNAKNKTKAMWQTINKEAGKLFQFEQKIELNSGIEKVNPQNVTEMLNSFFQELQMNFKSK
jgi:hypothetical protein